MSEPQTEDMQYTSLNPSFFPTLFPKELLPLAGQLDLVLYTSGRLDLCAPPMGGWHFVGSAGLSSRELTVQAWHASIPEAIKACALSLSIFQKAQAH
jgi:hypothetical protein